LHAGKKEFIPTDVSIPEWPLDFLAYIAHHTKYKRNPRLSIVSISKPTHPKTGRN